MCLLLKRTIFGGAYSIHSSASGDLYSLSDIINIDSLEKSRLPIYNTENYKEGVYKNYNSFKNQLPDYKISFVDTSNDNLISVKAFSEKNREFHVHPTKIYAAIFNNKIFASTNYGYRPLTKVNNDFYLVGTTKIAITNSAERQLLNGVLNGGLFILNPLGGIGAVRMVGGLNNRRAVKKKFEMKLDHIDGLFIKLNEIQ